MVVITTMTIVIVVRGFPCSMATSPLKQILLKPILRIGTEWLKDPQYIQVDD
jgi:hypothetical protein